jgi:GNAT superfamily N-acetyltransferase
MISESFYNIILPKYGLKNLLESIGIENSMINEWINADETYFYAILNKYGYIISFVLLSTSDFDPLDIHNDIKFIHYIHTFPNYRRKGYASKLIKKIQYDNNFYTFCETKESKLLFINNNCLQVRNYMGIYLFRYPY